MTLDDLKTAYQRALDDATMEFIDDEHAAHDRGLRVVLMRVADAADNYENEHLGPGEFDALYAFADELRHIATEEPNA